MKKYIIRLPYIGLGAESKEKNLYKIPQKSVPTQADGRKKSCKLKFLPQKKIGQAKIPTPTVTFLGSIALHHSFQTLVDIDLSSPPQNLTLSIYIMQGF